MSCCYTYETTFLYTANYKVNIKFIFYTYKKMQFYLFFMEYSLRETDIMRWRQLCNLSFGIGGLIFWQDKLYLSLTKHELCIPNEHIMKDHAKLIDLLWDSKSEYKKFEETIFTAWSSWCQKSITERLKLLML